MTDRTAQYRQFVLRLLECMYPRLNAEERDALDDIISNKITGLSLDSSSDDDDDCPETADSSRLEAAETLMAWVEERLTPLKVVVVGTNSAINAQTMADAMGSTLGQLIAEIVLCAGPAADAGTVNRAVLDWAMDNNVILSWIEDPDILLDNVHGVVVIADDSPWPEPMKSIIKKAQDDGLMFHYTVLPTASAKTAKKPTKSRTKK